MQLRFHLGQGVTCSPPAYLQVLRTLQLGAVQWNLMLSQQQKSPSRLWPHLIIAVEKHQLAFSQDAVLPLPCCAFRIWRLATRQPVSGGSFHIYKHRRHRNEVRTSAVKHHKLCVEDRQFSLNCSNKKLILIVSQMAKAPNCRFPSTLWRRSYMMLIFKTN